MSKATRACEETLALGKITAEKGKVMIDGAFSLFFFGSTSSGLYPPTGEYDRFSCEPLAGENGVLVFKNCSTLEFVSYNWDEKNKEFLLFQKGVSPVVHDYNISRTLGLMIQVRGFCYLTQIPENYTGDKKIIVVDIIKLTKYIIGKMELKELHKFGKPLEKEQKKKERIEEQKKEISKLKNELNRYMGLLRKMEHEMKLSQYELEKKEKDLKAWAEAFYLLDKKHDKLFFVLEKILKKMRSCFLYRFFFKKEMEELKNIPYC